MSYVSLTILIVNEVATLSCAIAREIVVDNTDVVETWFLLMCGLFSNGEVVSAARLMVQAELSILAFGMYVTFIIRSRQRVAPPDAGPSEFGGR